jgi:hypothetical protein
MPVVPFGKNARFRAPAQEKARFLAARVRSPTATENACAAAATAAALASTDAPLPMRVAADLAVSARRCRHLARYSLAYQLRATADWP